MSAPRGESLLPPLPLSPLSLTQAHCLLLLSPLCCHSACTRPGHHHLLRQQGRVCGRAASGLWQAYQGGRGGGGGTCSLTVHIHCQPPAWGHQHGGILLGTAICPPHRDTHSHLYHTHPFKRKQSHTLTRRSRAWTLWSRRLLAALGLSSRTTRVCRWCTLGLVRS